MRLPCRIGRQQPGVLARDVQHDRTRFEQLEVAVLQRRHLAERLAGAVRRLLDLAEFEQVGAIRLADLLERPAHSQVAHQPARRRRHPAERGQRRRGHAAAPCSACAASNCATSMPHRGEHVPVGIGEIASVHVAVLVGRADVGRAPGGRRARDDGVAVGTAVHRQAQDVRGCRLFVGDRQLREGREEVVAEQHEDDVVRPLHRHRGRAGEARVPGESDRFVEGGGPRHVRHRQVDEDLLGHGASPLVSLAIVIDSPALKIMPASVT